MRFLASILSIYAISAGMGAASVAFDPASVAVACGSEDCPAAVADSFTALSDSGSDQARIDEFVAALAGELLLLAQDKPKLSAQISEALELAARHATPGSALARDVTLLAQLIADGHASSLSLTAFNGAAQPLSNSAPTGGTNGSDS
ncbi:hypothetical protein LZA78_01550 [Sinirhodobacter sp. WL0062]|uniref:Uncharacterized protein n=1 Tax=Rhodobacter flavimaris TaxID=2907145 RepID=A0ABS8YSB4_9RHOB|nr:hypothetical protein [Sinirhodobacter sp. WL0062]MCE5972175.1 hypothetical protein [Sinirhodobacter sp. WL0062]